MSKKKETAVTEYEVLIACRSDQTGKSYKPGDTVTVADFPAEVIANWQTITPPVLRVKKGKEGKEGVK